MSKALLRTVNPHVDHKKTSQESSKAAQKVLELESWAKELTQAAAGASDSDERQKLLNETFSKSIEAQSFDLVPFKDCSLGVGWGQVSVLA
jgi:hypothetical protein